MLVRLTSASVNSGRAKRLPHDSLADVCSDEEGDTRSKPIALLQ